MKCQICGTEVAMPHTCTYCGGQFCSQHRLPENHACPQINRVYTQRQYTTTNTGSGYNYSFNFNPQQQATKTRRRNTSSPKELQHILIACLLVIGIGFSIGVYSGWEDIWMMTVFSVCIMSSFLVHELAHKIIAQKHGLWAEFRLTMWGAIITVISVFLPIKMIAPGAMMISGSTTKKGILKISIAGPITNIIFAAVFLALTLTLQSTAVTTSVPWIIYVFAISGFINAFMAVLNLVPFGMLDGLKIFTVDKKIWAAAFIPSLILFIIGCIIIW